MFGTIKGRIAIILAVLAVALGALLTRGVTRGLDLQGGMYLALEIDDPQNQMDPAVKRENIDKNLEILRNRIDQFGVAEPSVQKVGDERIVVQLPGIRDEERAKGVIERQAFLEWKLVKPGEPVTGARERIDRAVMAALPATERASAERDSARGESVRDLLFQRGGADSARADTAGAAASADTADTLGAAAEAAAPFSSLLLQGGGEGEFLVDEADVEKLNRFLALPGVKDVLPRGVDLKWAAETISQGASLYRSLYVLAPEAFITGDQLEDAQAGRDPQYNQTIVSFELNRAGGRVFDRVTSQNIGKRIAIVLDNQVHSAPQVQSRIGARGQIEMGQAPMEAARDLALVLRAGAFTAPLHIVEQRSVGPSLGADSIRQGMVAGIIGVLLVVAIMVGVYRCSGFRASVGLVGYAIILLGMLAVLGATLTAPGIAGFILSLGMAVDANVLIFERTREELMAGHTTRLAVDAGFKHAMSAIIDSNLTTVITGLILYKVGTGPVQGFAVTLTLGVLASFFTAVFVTRTLYLIYLDRHQAGEPISI
ncbi:MAG: protein translocase subunit SecD [Gemmatimonadetes bacterium]|nr:protein translocase subunit SecD [Gemmatimonadota bacterium]